MTAAPDVVIVGGGIVGLSLALAAADRGLASTVIDRPLDGAASRAAAGMLAPSLEGMPDSVLPHALAARDFYPRFLDALYERTARRVELNREGILELADHEGELAALANRAHSSARIIAPRELAALEPALAPHAGAVLHLRDGAVDNVALMEAMLIAAEREPRISLRTGYVTQVILNGRPAVVLEGGTIMPSDHVVIAGGAWANELPGLPRRIPVRPVRGQLLTLRGRPLRHVMYAPRMGYLVPRGDDLVVGATIEETGFVNETTLWGRQELLSIVARTLPGLANATVLNHWAGLRPMTPDTLPVLGPDPEHPALVYACGFSRNGILLAPWAAEQLAEYLTQERLLPSLDSFSIRRFGEQ